MECTLRITQVKTCKTPSALDTAEIGAGSVRALAFLLSQFGFTEQHWGMARTEAAHFVLLELSKMKDLLEYWGFF